MGILSKLFSKDYKDITSEELKLMMKEKNKYQFLDVRTQKEYKSGHAFGFNKNLDYYKFARNRSMLERINLNKPVVVMCQTGARSNVTCRILSKMGHKEVYNFKRGIRNYHGTITNK